MTTVTQARYSGVAMILHWLIAIAVIVNWRLAENFEHAEDADKLYWITQHKALGITILILSVLRLLWRFTRRPPELAASLAGWERSLARAVHVIFYVMLIGLPIGGWVASSFSHYPIDFWGLFNVPLLPVAENKELGHEIAEAHGAGATFLLLLVVLHIVGALKHTLIDKDGNIHRMLPWGPEPKA
ncbi:cytochrome b [Altererythrobacter sp.]|uniref:cytochrome b n=1 Tax=Altererythrobacter sp. TaxID=1872480 RepID=UPI003D00AB90